MRILLTRLSALGDIIHTWPLAAALTAGREPVELAWVVEEPFLPLVAGHPAVAVAIPVATRRWRRHPLAAATWSEIGAARGALRGFAPDVALDPQGLIKSAVWGWLAGATERVGLGRAHRREALARAWYTRTVMPSPGVRHVVDVNLSLLAALGRPVPVGAVPDGRFLLPGGGERAPGRVALLPATGGVGKSWPVANFAALARRVAAQGLQPLVVWGPGERALAEEMAAAAGGSVAMAPPTSIPELVGVLGTCAVVVGGDTGPVHLAAALGVPTVAVFLATDAERNGPRGARVWVVAATGAAVGRGRARTRASGAVSVDAVCDAVRAAAEERNR